MAHRAVTALLVGVAMLAALTPATAQDNPIDAAAPPGTSDTVGLVDTATGLWHLYDATGVEMTSFHFGNPDDYPFMGDWNCDGTDTPGTYRQTDGYVYLRNSNSEGNADISFYFGDPGDVPVAGDFNDDGCDTVSLYRPSEQRFYIINALGKNDGSLGAASFSYLYGDPGDQPFFGDWIADGADTPGLHRPSTGFMYMRNSNTQGTADLEFFFGDPSDRVVAGDWTGDGVSTPAVYRASDTTVYFRYSNSQGNADFSFKAGGVDSVPVAGNFGTFPTDSVLSGSVSSGGSGIGSSVVSLYAARSSGAPDRLGQNRTADDGTFSIKYNAPLSDDAVLYVVAEGGRNEAGVVLPDSFAMAAAIGTDPVPTVVVNEITTVATAYSMAQFLSTAGISGPAPGLQLAAGMVANVADVATGELGPTVTDGANAVTSTPATIASLGNMLAACVAKASACAELLSESTPEGNSAVSDTFQALGSMARNPWNNIEPLFALSEEASIYGPGLSSAPTGWHLPIVFVGDGTSFNGPGQIAFDENGLGWIGNNYQYVADKTQPACASHKIFRLDPTVMGPASVTTFTGGGIDGVGFGTAIDIYGQVWMANFGFRGTGCTEPAPPYSVSAFNPDGSAISGPTGFVQGSIDLPQGTASDNEGNMWFANCGNSSVTMYQDGDPDDHLVYQDIQDMGKPFGLATDDENSAWVTANRDNNVFHIRRVGDTLVAEIIEGDGFLDRPMGIAVDSRGGKWISNSGLVDAPCPVIKNSILDGDDPGTVTWLKPDGTVGPDTTFGGAGLTNPWGIAIDGSDRVYVGNFGGSRLSVLCGADTTACPMGATTGDAISGSDGYGWDGLVRVTGVAVDPAGNVWAMNNWENIPLQTNPGGNGAVAFLGLATPVVTPLVGLPEQP